MIWFWKSAENSYNSDLLNELRKQPTQVMFTAISELMVIWKRFWVLFGRFWYWLHCSREPQVSDHSLWQSGNNVSNKSEARTNHTDVWAARAPQTPVTTSAIKPERTNKQGQSAHDEAEAHYNNMPHPNLNPDFNLISILPLNLSLHPEMSW